MTPTIELRNVSKHYPAGGLKPTSLALEKGQHLVLLGPTGSGKSTLLRLIAGLETPDDGDIFLSWQRVNDVRPHERGVAFLPQRAVLYPHLNVKENLELVAGAGPSPNPSLEGRGVEILNVAPLLDRMPNTLSGGEKQRVALAKLCRRQAGVWLLDEPFAPLDPVLREEFRAALPLILASLQATMILVSHDPNDALALGRLVGVLGDGVLQQLDTFENLRTRPGNRFVAGTLGQLPFAPNV